MFLKITLDVLLVFLLSFGIVYGYKKGFLKSAARPIRFVAAFLTAFWLSNPISKSIIEPMIKRPVTSQIKEYLFENCPNITPESAADELPTLLRFSASLLDVDVATLSSENIIETIVDSITSPVVHLISLIFTFVIVYFLSKLLYSVLISFASSCLKSGAISLPNKLLGMLFGLILAASLAWITTLLFDFIIHSSLFDNAEWAQTFEGGAVFRFFSKNSPIDILLGF